MQLVTASSSCLLHSLSPSHSQHIDHSVMFPHSHCPLLITTQVLGTIKLLVLHSWIPGPHQVVEEHACCGNELDGLGLLLHRAQENLEPIGQDAEGIFYYPSGRQFKMRSGRVIPRRLYGFIMSGRKAQASSPTKK